MSKLGQIAAIWRYPVKSLAPQRLESVRIDADGVEGDRVTALRIEAGHARAGKPYRGKEHNLLHTVQDTAAAIALAAARGVTVSLESKPGDRYFDDAPVSLVFDRWIAQVEAGLHIKLDPLRWRPNLYAVAAPDFSLSEEDLVGEVIFAGEVRLRVRETIRRCVATTYDVATGERNDEVLGYVARHRNNVMGVYCEVELTGTVRAGDDLRLRAR